MCGCVSGICCYFEIAKVAVALVALVLTLKQIKVATAEYEKGQKFQRVQLLWALYDETRKDDNVAKIVSIIDWDCGKGTQSILSFDGEFSLKATEKFGEMEAGDLERKIDAVLALFNHVCYLRSLNAITDDDMKMFEYRLKRIGQHNAIKKYLLWLKDFAGGQDATMSFDCLLEYLKHNCWK